VSDEKPRLRVLLDEGVPRSVGRVLAADGHEVLYFEEVLVKGSADPVVCTAADANQAILVALDNDMKAAAKRQGIGQNRYRRLSLIKLSCRESNAAQRLSEALGLIRSEWQLGADNASRRIFIEIGDGFIKTHR
jgi:predicted nuclease of predicted toxin-antitoxin system